MKILIDARLYGLENAGLGRYTLNLLESLKKIDRRNKYIILLRSKYFNSLKFPPTWKKVKADYQHYSLREQVSLTGLIRKEKPDVVHFPHFNVPLSFKGRFVVTIHDLLMHSFKGKESTTLPFPLYSIKRMGYRLVFDNAVKRAVKIIVPTKWVKREVLRVYHIDKDKINVTYEGFNHDLLNAVSNKSVVKRYDLPLPYFFYVGNAYPHKNLERGVEAVVKLNKGGKKAILAIASSRDVFYKRLQKKIKKLKAEKYVKLLGFVPDDDLLSLYQNSAALFYPSLSEGFGLQGLEAMASGTIALVSDIPVFKEVYKDKAVYFNPYDFTSMSDAMENVLNLSPDKRDRLIKRGKEFVKTYTWDKMARQTLKIYESSTRIRQG